MEEKEENELLTIPLKPMRSASTHSLRIRSQNPSPK